MEPHPQQQQHAYRVAYAVVGGTLSPAASNVLRYTPPHFTFSSAALDEGFMVAVRKPAGWRGAYVAAPTLPSAPPLVGPGLLAVTVSGHEGRGLLVAQARRVLIATPKAEMAPASSSSSLSRPLRMHEVLFPSAERYALTLCEELSVHALQAGSMVCVSDPMQSRISLLLLFMPGAEMGYIVQRCMHEMLVYMDQVWQSLGPRLRGNTAATTTTTAAVPFPEALVRPRGMVDEAHMQLCLPPCIQSSFKLPPVHALLLRAPSSHQQQPPQGAAAEEGADRHNNNNKRQRRSAVAVAPS